MLVYAVVDDALSPDFSLGDVLGVFIRREDDPEQFIEEVRATIRDGGEAQDQGAGAGGGRAELR